MPAPGGIVVHSPDIASANYVAGECVDELGNSRRARPTVRSRGELTEEHLVAPATKRAICSENSSHCPYQLSVLLRCQGRRVGLASRPLRGKERGGVRLVP